MEHEDLCFRQSFQHFVRDFCAFHENFAVDLHYELEVMGSSRDTQLNYGLCIPSRYPIGEITHGDRRGERIFSKQKTPSMYSWCEVFESYFGHYVRYDEADEKIAFVEFREGQVDETGDFVGVVSVLFQANCEYPFPRTRSREHDLEMQCNTLLDRVLHLEQQCKQGAAHLRYMKTVMLDIYIRSECPVCLHDIAPQQLAIPDCGHILCKSCEDQCRKCPVCRFPLTGNPC